MRLTPGAGDAARGRGLRLEAGVIRAGTTWAQCRDSGDCRPGCQRCRPASLRSSLPDKASHSAALASALALRNRPPPLVADAAAAPASQRQPPAAATATLIGPASGM